MARTPITYAPSDAVYWQHGQSTERDFIYVTTQMLTREQLARLSEEVGEKRTLMVFCTPFRVKPSAFPTVRNRDDASQVRIDKSKCVEYLRDKLGL